VRDEHWRPPTKSLTVDHSNDAPIGWVVFWVGVAILGLGVFIGARLF
jgi:hypothetical protein